MLDTGVRRTETHYATTAASSVSPSISPTKERDGLDRNPVGEEQGPKVGVRRDQGRHRELPVPDPRHSCDNGGEFINQALIGWCAERTIFMTRARPPTSNDNAHVEQKNGAIVRKSAFRYHYDTPEELALLNELWGYVNLRKNMFLPTKKTNGWADDEIGAEHPHLRPAADPYQRVLTAGNLTSEPAARLAALHAATNPADLTRNIVRLQQQLIDSTKAKTLALRSQVS